MENLELQDFTIQPGVIDKSQFEKINEYALDIKAKYQDLVSKKAELVEIEKAIEGLNNFTKLVKNSIIPSLSKIAKSLVNEMSNGEISDVTIDEDFNIEVDNKELNLLSGSEKAIANLAIRLA